MGNAASRFATELAEWKRRRGIAADTHVFSITGAFPGIRNALVERGWVENDDKTSLMWEFKYALWQRDIGELGDLDDSQVINYFARNSELTSKAGLCNNLYSCCTLGPVDVDSFYPRCYDLTSTTQVDDFIQNFKATSCMCLLKHFVMNGGRTAEGGAGSQGFPRQAVITALDVCRRRCLSVDATLDESPQPLVSDAEWHILGLLSLKRPGRELKPWGRKASQAQASASVAAAPAESANDGAASDASDAEGNDGVCADGFKTTRDKVDEDLFIEAGQVLDKLRSQLPQSNLDGLQNIWVLKPAGKSRGRGIQLSARLENILEIGVGRGAEARWIAQKYMENPLIIQGKKFDIRQWVVVTRWNPLSVWFYKDCYLRFSFADYDPKKLKNKFAHLTNNSISKHADDFDEQRDDTMWHSDDFQEYLASLRFEKDGKIVDDPWTDVVQKQMKQVVMWSLESVADAVMPRNSAFELFGYDFMVCEDLNAWLIEVNSSPDLSYSTATTRGLVKSMLEDMVRVVVDIEKFGLRPDRPKKKWDTCRLNSGRFELLEPGRRRRQEKCSRLRKDAGQLCIHGSALKPRRPRKGECPNGIDAPDDPKFDALALLSTADGTGDQTADDRDGLGVYQDAASEAEESDGSSVVGVPGGE